MAEAASINRLQKAAEGYLNNARFSDFTIVCEGKEFKVHRCFISAHSKYFERACSGMFKEASAQSIELKDDLLQAVECMILFFYTCQYNDDLKFDEGAKKPDAKDKQPIYATAEKYEVLDLKALALEKFMKASEELITFPLRLLQVTYTIYTHLPLPDTDRTLHNAVLDYWLLLGKSCVDSARSGNLLASFASGVPQFTTDLTWRMLSNSAASVRLNCRRCGSGYDVAKITALSAPVECKTCGPNAKADATQSINFTVRRYA